MRTFLAAVAALLLLPAAAQAGGWASAGVLNPPQGDVKAGEIWPAKIEILQHGRTPMEGLTPAVIVGGERFEARPVEGRAGLYTAEVVFPKAGRVHYRVDDGFTNVEAHTFVATIGDRSAPAAAGGGFPWLPVTGAALAAVALTLLLLRRRRSPVPA